MMNLSPSEREVCSLICEGLQNKEIARRLGKTVGTVKGQMMTIYLKLGAKNRTQAAMIFRERLS